MAVIGKPRRICLIVLVAACSVAQGADGPVLHIDWPSAEQATDTWPVTGGIPFGRDAKPNLENLRLVDDKGRSVPSQWRVLQRWQPEGGARWVSVDFNGDPACRSYRVQQRAAETPKGIEVLERADHFEVDTGSLRVEIPKRNSGGLFRRVWLNDRLVCDNTKAGVGYLVDQKGTRCEATRDAGGVKIERKGPLRTVLLCEGSYATPDGKTTCAYRARLHFYHGKSFVRLQHTFLFTENSAELQIRDLGVTVSLAPNVRAKTAVFDASSAHDEKRQVLELTNGFRSASLLQDVYYHLLQPESHWGLYVTGRDGKEREVLSGERAGNWCSLAADDAAVTVLLKNFWQEFPKELSTDGRSITAHFWSSKRGKALDFRLPAVLDFWGKENIESWRSRRLRVLEVIEQGRYRSNARGLARTHEVLFHFHDPKKNPVEAARHFSQPPLACPDPEWTSSTDVAGLLSPRDAKQYPDAEKALDVQLGVIERAIREWGNYGWWEHGAGPHLVYHVTKQKPVAQPKRYTGGVEYWYSRAMWIGYLRSGDRRYFEVVAPHARHFMDVVFCHMDTDTRWRGDFYWSPGETPIHWGGNKHVQMIRTPTAGVHAQFGFTIDAFLYYYYLTGDDRAWHVVREYADLYLRLLDYPEWVDDTLKAANIMWSRKVFATLDELSILYEATGDERFRKLARQLAAKVLKPDLPGGIHREPQFRQEKKLYPEPYAIYYKSPCVIRYARATGDPAGRDTLLRMVKYNFENGRWTSRYAGVRYAYARLWGGPDVYVAAGREGNDAIRRMRYVVWPRDSKWPMNPGGSTLGAASLILSTNAQIAAERRFGRPQQRLPVLSRSATSPAGEILVRKEPGKPASLGIRISEPELRIQPKQAVVQSRRYYRNSYHDVTLPADAPASLYRIPVPARASASVITCENARYALYAPQGFPVEAEVDSGRWFFRVPKDCRGFEVEAADPGYVRLESPTGRRVRLEDKGKTLHRIVVRPGEQTGPWAVWSTVRTFVRCAEIRPAFAYRDRTQLFETPSFVTVVDASRAGKRSRFEDGVAGKGVYIGNREALSIPTGRRVEPLTRRHFDAKQGTIEFWFRTEWPYFLSPDGASRTLAYVPGPDEKSPVLNVYYSRLRRSSGLMAYDIRGGLGGEAGTIGMWGRTRARWMPGEWVHMAIQWGPERGAYALTYYVNGKEDGNKSHRQRARRVKGFRPHAPGDVLLIAGGRRSQTSLDAVIDELRISKVQRYQKDFKPKRRLQMDEHTLALFRFDGDLSGRSGADPNASIEAKLATVKTAD